MANAASFDITSNVDLQEVDNAVNQARKEVAQRYDFKGSRAEIGFDRTGEHADARRRRRVQVERAVGDRAGTPGAPGRPGQEPHARRAGARAANDTVRRVMTLQQGIPDDAAKQIVKFLKDQKLKKVQAAIQADQVRVSSNSKDELQNGDPAAAGAGLRRRPSIRELPRIRSRRSGAHDGLSG